MDQDASLQVDTGRALVPEGTVVPAGVRFFVTEHSGKIRDWKADADSRQRIPLVFAYAPASKFAEARQVIDATRAVVPAPTLQYVDCSGGFCGTPSYYPTSQQAPNPTVDASGSIFQRWWGCWTNPNSPCMRYYSGTIQVTFP